MYVTAIPKSTFKAKNGFVTFQTLIIRVLKNRKPPFAIYRISCCVKNVGTINLEQTLLSHVLLIVSTTSFTKKDYEEHMCVFKSLNTTPSKFGQDPSHRFLGTHPSMKYINGLFLAVIFLKPIE